MRIWTNRAPLTEADKIVIAGIAEAKQEAIRLFVTGEAREDYLGKQNAEMFEYSNALLEKHGTTEPLFIRTRDNTVRMARFCPDEVWRCIHADKLVKAVKEESDRLGIKPVTMHEFDFYRSLGLDLMRKTTFYPGTVIAQRDDPDYKYQVMYMGALLLFNKPGYRAVPVEKHFCLKETEDFCKGMNIRVLNTFERNEYEEVLEAGKDIDALTNAEIALLDKLYNNDVHRGEQ
jgi:hypothetical protein